MNTIRFSDLSAEGKESKVRTIRQADICACPHLIMVASHYRDDGSCKCDDPDEQARMIREWGYSRRDFKR